MNDYAKKTALFFFFLFSASLAFGQYGKPKEYNGGMYEGYKEGYQIIIPSEDEDAVLKMVKKEVHDYKAKTKNKKGGVLAEEVEITGTAGAVNCYFTAKAVDDGEVGLEAYIFAAGTSMQNDKVKSWLEEFGPKIARKMLEEQIKDKEKELKDTEKELNSFVDDVDKAKKDIKDCEQEIAENEALIEKRTTQISESKELVKDKERELKALEKKKGDI